MISKILVRVLLSLYNIARVNIASPWFMVHTQSWTQNYITRLHTLCCVIKLVYYYVGKCAVVIIISAATRCILLKYYILVSLVNRYVALEYYYCTYIIGVIRKYGRLKYVRSLQLSPALLERRWFITAGCTISGNGSVNCTDAIPTFAIRVAR